MSELIRKSVDQISVALLTTEPGGTPLDIGMWSQGEVFVPTGETVVTLTFHGAPNSKGTFLPLQTGAGAALTQTVAGGKAYPIPAAVFGCACIKVTGDVAATVHFTFKS